MKEMVDRELDLVVGWRRNRQDPFIRTLPSRVANAIISVVTGVPLHDTGCSLKVGGVRGSGRGAQSSGEG